MSSVPRPLEWATDSDLWEELTKRYHGIILAFEEPERNGRITVDVRWDGSPALALGLVAIARVRLLHAFDDQRDEDGKET